MPRLPPRMLHLFAPALLLLAVGCTSISPKAQKTSDAIRIPFETYKLSNGLTVILSPDKTTPTVVVDLWYHVGSKNEKPGRSGFAHLFEHVMFMGSLHAPYGMHDKLTGTVGGYNNATTANDRTNYFDVVPANYLESTLWLESDRLGFLPDSLTQGKLDAQRAVVNNERRQNFENQPYGLVEETILGTLFPVGHPYHFTPIGAMKDVNAASLDDVKSFFRTYYLPSNGTLAIVGDFDPTQAKTWVAKYFGDLPKGKPIERPAVPAVTLDGEKRLILEDQVEVAQLNIGWPTVGVHDDDHYALSVLDAILAGPRTARLTKALVYDSQSAAEVGAWQDSMENGGEFRILVTPRPGHSLTELEYSVDEILQRMIKDGPTPQEIQKATAGAEFAFLHGLESNLGKADQLLEGAVYHNDAGYFRTDYQKLLAVTAADVQRVARKYLTPGRVVLSVVPMGKLDQASKPGQGTKITPAPSEKPEGVMP